MKEPNLQLYCQYHTKHRLLSLKALTHFITYLDSISYIKIAGISDEKAPLIIKCKEIPRFS